MRSSLPPALPALSLDQFIMDLKPRFQSLPRRCHPSGSRETVRPKAKVHSAQQENRQRHEQSKPNAAAVTAPQRDVTSPRRSSIVDIMEVIIASAEHDAKRRRLACCRSASQSTTAAEDIVTNAHKQLQAEKKHHISQVTLEKLGLQVMRKLVLVEQVSRLNQVLYMR